ncbi:MAG: hypothetical protein SF162_08370 [bacterium]|nr:hypothetical protein [bacterium]
MSNCKSPRAALGADPAAPGADPAALGTDPAALGAKHGRQRGERVE